MGCVSRGVGHVGSFPARSVAVSRTPSSRLAEILEWEELGSLLCRWEGALVREVRQLWTVLYLRVAYIQCV